MKNLRPSVRLSKPHLLLYAMVFGFIGIFLYLSLAAPNPNLTGDLNNDGKVDGADLSVLATYWHTNNPAADITKDNYVDLSDLAQIILNFGKTAALAKPSIPTGLAATAGDGSAALKWTANPASDNVDSYQVYWSTDSSFATFSQNLNVTGTSFSVTGLTNGTAYYFRISAHNANGYSSWGSSVSAVPQGAGGGGGGTGSGNGIGAIEEGDHFNVLTNPSKYGMIIVSQGDASAACAVPSPTRSLVYEAGTDVNNSYSNGVDWNTANANGWLLKNSSGGYLINQGYSNNYIGDVGSSGYQQAFISGVSSLLSSHNCKGVFIDDVLRDIKPLAGSYPAKYPSQSAWQSAMASFVSVVGPALKAKGYYVAINAVGYTSGDSASNDGSLDVSWWQQLGPSVSGLMNEEYVQTANNYTLRLSGTSSYTQFWDGWQKLIPTAQGMNRDFIGLTYGASATDYQTMRYGKGSFLLEWNGGTSIFMFSPGRAPLSSSDPSNANWTTDMGAPSGAKTQVQTGVWQRSYAKGTVIVNTTGSSVTVAGHTIASADAYIGP